MRSKLCLLKVKRQHKFLKTLLKQFQWQPPIPFSKTFFSLCLAGRGLALVIVRHTVLLEYHSVSPRVEIGTFPTPSPASDYAPPPGTKGGTHSSAGEGLGESQFQRLEKKHSTLSTLCCQVKVRGHRIDLSEIEAAAHRIAGVSRACALCFRPGQPDQRVLCYYTADEQEEEGKGAEIN
jgi:hypothetical protein